MPLIEGFWIRNYRMLKQVAIGSTFQQMVMVQDDTDFQPYPLQSQTFISGKSGTGKSTLLDVFAFLADCLNEGVEPAFRKRGGFHSIRSRGVEDDPISIGILFRACADPRPLTYIVSFDAPGDRKPIVANEALLYQPDEQNPDNTMLLFFQNGVKTKRLVAPWPGMQMDDLNRVKNIDARHLALPFLGKFEEYPDVFPLHQALSRWETQAMMLDLSAALAPPSIPRTENEIRINRLLVAFLAMEEKHRFELPAMLEQIARRLPDVERITFQRTESGRLMLYFKMSFFEEPLAAHELPRGLLMLFAHQLHLEDSIPMPLFGFDSPDEGLDPRQCRLFTGLVYNHTETIGSTQFLLTTQSPYLLDDCDPRDVWILEPGNDGFASVFRASDDLAMRGITMLSTTTRWFTDIVGREP